MSGVASGRLRHKVKLQEKRITQNPVTGAMISTWHTVASVWAAVEPLSAREFLAAGAEQSEVTGKIIIRRRSDVNATWRVLHRGMAYNVKGVLADADSGLEHLTLMVGTGVRVT